MIKELIIDGVRLKKLPGSDYWIMPDGTPVRLVSLLLDKQGRYHMRKSSAHVTRTKEELAALYSKLK